MAMAWIWTGMVAASVLYGLCNGTIGAVGTAALEGAGAAVNLCLQMAGILCLWSGVMGILRESGVTQALSRLFRPFLTWLFPNASRDMETLEALSGNLSCNLLGLGNAATPLGLRACTRMARGLEGRASDELCRLVVLNTASVQLLPTTVAGVRTALGSANGFDILPAVWLASLLSVSTGLLAAKLLGRCWR